MFVGVVLCFVFLTCFGVFKLLSVCSCKCSSRVLTPRLTSHWNSVNSRTFYSSFSDLMARWTDEFDVEIRISQNTGPHITVMWKGVTINKCHQCAISCFHFTWCGETVSINNLLQMCYFPVNWRIRCRYQNFPKYRDPHHRDVESCYYK